MAAASEMAVWVGMSAMRLETARCVRKMTGLMKVRVALALAVEKAGADRDRDEQQRDQRGRGGPEQDVEFVPAIEHGTF